jgi:hypothetical protein
VSSRRKRKIYKGVICKKLMAQILREVKSEKGMLVGIVNDGTRVLLSEPMPRVFLQRAIKPSKKKELNFQEEIDTLYPNHNQYIQIGNYVDESFSIEIDTEEMTGVLVEGRPYIVYQGRKIDNSPPTQTQ